MSSIRADSGRPTLRAECLSSAEKREQARKFCAATIEHHYDERLKRWNAELDMLLVFAGLFSAALTAFNVQSYLLLQPDNTDTMVLALVRISTQLESFVLDSRSINSSAPAFTPPQSTAFAAPGYAIWMNALWFSSLTCTLSASSVAVMVKQWLHQYAQGLSGNSAEMTRLRQYRYDSLVKWHVPEIIAALPILLQAALSLFFAGLVILLSNLHSSVAITVSVFVGSLMLFTAATTVLPAYYSDCCYQSPQALSVFIFVQQTRKAFVSLLEWVERQTQAWTTETASGILSQSSLLSYLRFTVQSALSKVEVHGPFHNWQAREKPDVDAQREELEQSIALTTYKIISDKAVLSGAVIPCLSSMDALSERMSIQYGDLILSISEKLKRAGLAAWRPVMPFILVVLSLIVKEPRPGAVQKILASIPEHRLTSAKSNVGLLFLLSMANLVANGIAARKAFENLLSYLRNTQVDQETTTTLGQTVLQDVEAVFPLKWSHIEDLVNLDNFTSISHYLTGIECIALYLLRHGETLTVPLLPMEQRLLRMILRFRSLLTCPAWQSSHSRQENVLWALRCSRLPELLQKLVHEPGIAAGVRSEAIASMSALHDVLGILQLGAISQQSASPGTKQAFERLKSQIQGQHKPHTQVKRANSVGSSDATPRISITSTTVAGASSSRISSNSSDVQTLVADASIPELQRPQAPPASVPSPSSIASPTPSAEAGEDTEEPNEDEVDIVDISFILDMGVVWDEMPPTPRVDSTRLSLAAIPTPTAENFDEDWHTDPVLPRTFEGPAAVPFRRRVSSSAVIPAILEVQDEATSDLT